MADEEEEVDAAGVHSAVVRALRMRLKRDESLNRYQLAVAVGERAAGLGPFSAQAPPPASLSLSSCPRRRRCCAAGRFSHAA